MNNHQSSTWTSNIYHPHQYQHHHQHHQTSKGCILDSGHTQLMSWRIIQFMFCQRSLNLPLVLIPNFILSSDLHFQEKCCILPEVRFKIFLPRRPSSQECHLVRASFYLYRWGHPPFIHTSSWRWWWQSCTLEHGRSFWIWPAQDQLTSVGSPAEFQYQHQFVIIHSLLIGREYGFQHCQYYLP